MKERCRLLVLVVVLVIHLGLRLTTFAPSGCAEGNCPEVQCCWPNIIGLRTWPTQTPRQFQIDQSRLSPNLVRLLWQYDEPSTNFKSGDTWLFYIWRKPSGALNYPSSPVKKISARSGSSWVLFGDDDNVSPGTTYTYRLQVYRSEPCNLDTCKDNNATERHCWSPYSSEITVTVPTPGPSVTRLVLDRQVVVGSTSLTGTVTLSDKAPSGGIPITLASSPPGVVSFTPSNITVPQGEISTAFTINTTLVPSTTQVRITASANGYGGKDQMLSVEAPQLAPLALTANRVNGGGSVGGMVSLSGSALPVDLTVQLSSSRGAWIVPPPSVVIPAGSTSSPNFTIATQSITSTIVGDVVATVGALSYRAELRVMEPQIRRAVRRGYQWLVENADTTPSAGVLFGIETDEAVSRDYEGRGYAQLTIFRAGQFWVRHGLPTGPLVRPLSGALNGRAAPADYKGLGTAQFAAYQPSQGILTILKPDLVEKDDSVRLPQPDTDDIPVPGNYEADGRARFAVYRPATGAFIVRKDDGTTYSVTLGLTPQANDKPVPGNYDGKGRTQFAIYRPSNQTWYIWHEDGRVTPERLPGAAAGDLPVPGPYLNTGADQIAVFRPGTAEWIIRDAPVPIKFGLPNDFPVPAPFADNFGN
jgi:hypothetical protein